MCPTELLAFNDRLAEFKQLKAEVYGVSVDSVYSHLAWTRQPRQQGGLACPQRPFTLPLLSDLNRHLSEYYGVLEGEEGVSFRGLFLHDRQGMIRHSLVNDLGIGRSVEEALRTLHALQHHEEHGEVCPANWEPGQPAMKADPEGSLEYFRRQ